MSHDPIEGALKAHPAAVPKEAQRRVAKLRELVAGVEGVIADLESIDTNGSAPSTRRKARGRELLARFRSGQSLRDCHCPPLPTIA